MSCNKPVSWLFSTLLLHLPRNCRSLVVSGSIVIDRIIVTCTSSKKQKMYNLFQANAPFLYPLKNLWFSDVFGGIEIQNWPEMS